MRTRRHLATYRTQYGLPACTTANGCFRKVNQSGQQGNYPPGSTGWGVEESLDIDMVSAICPDCRVLVVGAGDLNAAQNTAVSVGAHNVSNSRGTGDSSSDSATVVAVYDSYGNGGWFGGGGTSVSSPIIASVYALAGKPPTSQSAASTLYAHPGSLYDVASGSNCSCSPSYLCIAGAGFDGPTGLGAPDGTAAFCPAAVTGRRQSAPRAPRDLRCPTSQQAVIHLRRTHLITGVAALSLAGVGVFMAGSATPAFAAPSWPTHAFAPYVDTGLSNTSLTSVASATGDKFFTLAFVNGAGCQWSLPDTSGWESQISDLRSASGDVSISFGGYTVDTDGTDLGNACSTASAAATQIEDVVTTFGITHLDFDIESNQLTDITDINRTNQALALLRSWGSSTGRSLSISYTIPVLPSGLTSSGTSILSNGRSNGFTPNVVNIMTMDYGSSGTEMGAAADSALDATASQVASAYGISSSAAYAMLGNTPMIGQNDSAGEIFTEADASTVEAYVASKDIAMLSFWSEGRDNGGCPGQASASSTCSGLSQSTYAFTDAFEKFSGGGGGNTGGPGELISAQSGKCLDTYNNAFANSTKEEIWTCHNGSGQTWTHTSAGQLTVDGGAFCLDGYANGTTPGTKVDLWSCNGGINQKWNINPNGTITEVKSGLCLDVLGQSITNGTQIDIYTCNGQANQKWSWS